MKQALQSLVLTVLLLGTTKAYSIIPPEVMPSKGCQTCLQLIDFDQDDINLQVYPNPVVNHFQITDNHIVSSIVVFDLLGKQVKKFQYRSGEKYFIGDLRKGIYLVQFKKSNNEVITTKRISKK